MDGVPHLRQVHPRSGKKNARQGYLPWRALAMVLGSTESLKQHVVLQIIYQSGFEVCTPICTPAWMLLPHAFGPQLLQSNSTYLDLSHRWQATTAPKKKFPRRSSRSRGRTHGHVLLLIAWSLCNLITSINQVISRLICNRCGQLI